MNRIPLAETVCFFFVFFIPNHSGVSADSREHENVPCFIETRDVLFG